MIPAAPQTFLVEAFLADKGRIETLRHPVIGWRWEQSGQKAEPILLSDYRDLPAESEYAVLFEIGEVYDPKAADSYADLDAWIREIVEPHFKKAESSSGGNPTKKREPESQTTQRAESEARVRATSPLLMTEEQERETDEALAEVEARAKMAQLHKDGVIQGAQPEPEPEPKAAEKTAGRKPRRTKRVPKDAADLI
jgi:hypothetical protein